VAQNITSATYKGVGKWVDEVGGGLRLLSDAMGPAAVSKEPPTLQGKAGHLITVMNDWEQFHTNAILLKSAKHCHSPIRALQGHEIAIWKSRPGYL